MPISRLRLGGVALLMLAVAALVAASYSPSPPTLQFVVSSDAHYGLTRPTFRGAAQVDAHVVNAALVAQMNTLPNMPFPRDGGLRGGERIGALDFVVETGDITNRQENADGVVVQSATASWSQFVADYLTSLHLVDRQGMTTPVYLLPGNHEASNAVGFYRTMSPETDVMPLVEIYNRMLTPSTPKSSATFDYARDRIFYTRELGGVHFVFLHVWPDSAMRAEMTRDLAQVPASRPVVIFAHDQPEVEAKHFINPNGAHDINATDRFENLLADAFLDGPSIEAPSLLEQAEFERFLSQHPNVTAYFHGNSNWQQFYDWNGPGRSVRLHTFRVDSPMKGAVSSLDETKLSFDVVTIDSEAKTMTVRECLWNADPTHPDAPITWGESVTVTLTVTSVGPRPST